MFHITSIFNSSLFFNLQSFICLKTYLLLPSLNLQPCNITAQFPPTTTDIISPFACFNLMGPWEIKWVSRSHPEGRKQSKVLTYIHVMRRLRRAQVGCRWGPGPPRRQTGSLLKVNERLNCRYYDHLTSPFPADRPDAMKHRLASSIVDMQTSAPFSSS